MQKVRIVSLEDDRTRVVAALHMMGALDLRKSELELGDEKPPAYSTDISDSLIKVNGALQLIPQDRVRSEAHMDVERLIAEVKKMGVLNQAYDLGGEKKDIEDDMRALDYAQHIAFAFSGMTVDFSRMRSDYLLYRAFETDKNGMRQFMKALKGTSGKDIEVNTAQVGKGDYLMLVAYDKKSNIDELVKAGKMEELDLTAKYLDSTPENILRNIKKRRSANQKRLEEMEKLLASISAKYYSKIANMKEMLEIELARSDASASFKRTEETFVVEGWVQKKRVSELAQGIMNVTKGKAYVEEIDAGEELAPTHTNRPKWLQPFDYLVSFYSVQRSDEIDPTWIFILSFPIFYGLMVSDVGYGIASLILATYITTRTDPDGLMYNAAKLWRLNSFAAMFFGVLSNQWFGFSLNYTAPFSFNWFKNTPELIAITIFFGLAQVILGLGIGVINSWGHHHKKMAYARVMSILVVVFGTIAVAGFFFGAVGGSIATVSAAIAAVSLVLAGIWSGEEATELVNLITHPLSYARLMGFGLSGVIIAFLIDMAFTPNLNQGIIVFVIYAIIFIALHFINMTLSIFEGLVQGVRLNFVEFFSKFYIGNGIRFRPFSYKRIYTKE